jgi:hypothetical protein
MEMRVVNVQDGLRPGSHAATGGAKQIQLSGKIRVENGTQMGTVFELGQASQNHPTLDDEREFRQLVAFPIVYDPEAMLQGYPKPGHFRFAASQRQRGYVADNGNNSDTTPVAPILSGGNRTPVGGGNNGGRIGRMVRGSGLVKVSHRYA